MTGSGDLTGKIALVTGATSGIGAALAEGLAAQGAGLMITGLDQPEEIEALRARLADQYGGGVAYYQADLGQPAEIAALVAACQERLGGPDIVINNAGIQHVAALEDFCPAKWDQMLAINLSAAFHVIRLTLPALRAAGWGRIINVASAHGLRASPFKAAYVAAKHGLVGLTKTVALETAASGITCNALCPGYVRTPLVAAQIPAAAKAAGLSEAEVVTQVMLAKQPSRAFVGFDELVGLTNYLCSQAARNLTGAALSIDGGWTAQ